ncbi:hypothetical protein EAE99_004088 [Botrytis elliptica]|nr:hypothetical protein EAE99_004088 [Botrytis elliptica]
MSLLWFTWMLSGLFEHHVEVESGWVTWYITVFNTMVTIILDSYCSINITPYYNDAMQSLRLSPSTFLSKAQVFIGLPVYPSPSPNPNQYNTSESASQVSIVPLSLLNSRLTGKVFHCTCKVNSLLENNNQ